MNKPNITSAKPSGIASGSRDATGEDIASSDARHTSRDFKVKTIALPSGRRVCAGYSVELAECEPPAAALTQSAYS